jgi:hypothetical protein
MRRLLVILSFVLISPALIAQQVLNNDGVLKLVKAGLSEDLVVTTINSNAGQYDTSAEALVALKEGGASEKVIAAVVNKAAAPKADAANPALEARPAVQASGNGTIHIYRYKQFQGSALHPSIYCDEIRLTRISGGRYLDVKVPVGTHTFYADDKQAGAVVNVEAGKDYYFRAEVQVGFWKGHFRLMMVPAEQGKYDLAKLQPSDDKEAVTLLPASAAGK